MHEGRRATVPASTDRPRDPLSWPDRAAIAAAIVVPGFIGGIQGLGNFLVLPLMKEFGKPRSIVIFLLEIGTLAMYFVIPVVGRVLLMVPPWLVMLSGAAIAGAGLLAASAASTLSVATGGFAVAQALGLGLCGQLACQTVIVRRTPHSLGPVSGGQTVALSLTNVALPLLVAPQIEKHGWRPTVAGCAIGILVLLPPLILMFLRGASARGQAGAVDPVIGAKPSNDLADERVPGTLEILATPAFWLLMISIVPVAIVAQALSVNIIPFYAELGVTTERAAYVLAGMGAASAVGALAIGFMVDRVRPAKMIALIAATALAGNALLGMGLGPPAVILIVMCGGLAGVAPTLWVAIRRYFGNAGYAPVAGLVAPFLLFSAFSGAGAGWLRDHLGSYHAVFDILAGVMAVSLLASLLLLRGRHPK